MFGFAFYKFNVPPKYIYKKKGRDILIFVNYHSLVKVFKDLKYRDGFGKSEILSRYFGLKLECFVLIVSATHQGVRVFFPNCSGASGQICACLQCTLEGAFVIRLIILTSVRG